MAKRTLRSSEEGQIFFHFTSTIGEATQKLRLRRRKPLSFAFSRVGDSFCEVTAIIWKLDDNKRLNRIMAGMWKKI